MPTSRAALALTAALATLATADAATVSGRFAYVDRPFTFDGFTGVDAVLPIRHATVEVIDLSNDAVLATGATSEGGEYSLQFQPPPLSLFVVRCASRTDQFGPPLRVSSNGEEYSLSSAPFVMLSAFGNVNLGTTIAQKVIDADGNQGNPFNVLDQMVSAFQYLQAHGAPAPAKAIKLVWPWYGSQMFNETTAYIGTVDAYDDLVILHELGHVVTKLHSKLSSPGGSHSFADSDQDPRLSFSEGWASFFGSAVRTWRGLPDAGFYLDCHAKGEVGPASVKLRARFDDAYPYGALVLGEADEVSVACVLWDLIDAGPGTDDDPLDGSFPLAGGVDGDRMAWEIFTGPVKQAQFPTIRDFWNGHFAPVAYGPEEPFRGVYTAWSMRFHEDAAEPNNTRETATPISFGAWSETRTLYFAADGPAPGEGDADHWSFTLKQGIPFEVETRYPGGLEDAGTDCDPFLTIFRPDGTEFAATDGGGTGRNAKLTLLLADMTGTWTARVTSKHAYRKTGSYEIRVLDLSPCKAKPLAISHGTGKPGKLAVPFLTVSAPPKIGGPPITLVYGDAPSSSVGVLLIGTQPIELPFDGGTLYVNPLLQLPLPTSKSGMGQFTFPIEPAHCGLVLHLQAIFPNTHGATGYYKTSQSPRLTLHFGT